MEGVIEQALVQHHPDISFVQVIAWLVNCVEVYSKSTLVGHGSGKFALLRENVPVFLHAAVEQGLCTQAHADAVYKEFERDWLVVREIVNTLVAVGHNPAFVQVEQQLANCCIARKHGTRSAHRGGV